MRAPSHFSVARHVTRVTMLTASLACAALVSACATPRGGDNGVDSAAATPGGTPGAAAGPTTGAVAPATGGNARITLELDRTRYAAGGTVNLRIVNQDDAGYGFSACQRAVERRRGGEWFTVPEEGRVCTMMLQLVGARQTVMAETELPSPLDAGEYRIVITFSREEGPAPGRDVPAPPATPSRIASAPFRVE